MTDEKREHSPHGRRDIDILLRYWPLIAGFTFAIMGYSELRYQVAQNSEAIEEQKQTDRAQWERIGNLLEQ